MQVSHPDDVAETKRQIDVLVAGEAASARFEKRYLRKDGAVVWADLSTSLRRDAEGRPLYFVTTIVDITERRRAEALLRETTEYLENLFGYANAPIIVWDADLRVTRFNRAFEDLTGRPASGVIGKKLDVLFPKGRIKQSLALVTAASAGERWEVVEIPILRVDGTVRTVLWNSATIYEVDGETPLATIAQGQDITERKQAEDELRGHRDHLELLVQTRTEELDLSNEELTSMNEELGSTNEELGATNEELVSLNEELAATNEELDLANSDLSRVSQELAAASHAKSEFLASMSHELRTPLNSIIGFSSVMLRGMAGRLTDEQERQLVMINESGTHLLSLINDILDLSRIEAGRLELVPEDLSVRDVARHAADTVRPLAEQRGLDMTTEIADDCTTVRSDSRSLHQILLNLLGNAVKFTEVGLVSLRVLRQGDELRFEVADTGIGIHAERFDDIFEEFKQYEQPGFAKPRGTGLGLPVSRRLAARLGGRIEVQSVVGEGSVFVLVLPIDGAALEA
jgi:PAS domain S-box-containing protein